MRSQRTRRLMVAQVREFMRTGYYRPTSQEVAKAADISVRSIFQHFDTMDALYVAAVDDPATAAAITDAIRGLPDATAVARAFVTGRLP